MRVVNLCNSIGLNHYRFAIIAVIIIHRILNCSASSNCFRNENRVKICVTGINLIAPNNNSHEMCRNLYSHYRQHPQMANQKSNENFIFTFTLRENWWKLRWIINKLVKREKKKNCFCWTFVMESLLTLWWFCLGFSGLIPSLHALL